ncbi:MAG: hypothetical protein HPM95_20460 [Alphaproteobacteria bacterium]|nr:hypothetical protein [Alphaproteobacteria bacterium]
MRRARRARFLLLCAASLVATGGHRRLRKATGRSSSRVTPAAPGFILSPFCCACSGSTTTGARGWKEQRLETARIQPRRGTGEAGDRRGA